MPTIKVNTRKLASYESDLQRILNRVNSIKNEFSSTSSSLDWDVKASSNINYRLSAINRELSAEARGISGMKNFLDTAQRKYDSVESTNSRKKLKNEVTGHGYKARVYNKRYLTKKTDVFSQQHNHTHSWRDINPLFYQPGYIPWNKGAYKSNQSSPEVGAADTALTLGFWGALSSFVKGEIATKTTGQVYEKANGDNYFKFLTGGTSASFKPGKYGQYKDDGAISDSINDLSDFLIGKNAIPKQKKNPIKQINPDESWYSKKGTIAEIKGEAKIEGSVIDAKASGEAKYAQGEIGAKVLTGEAHASANAGLYIFEKGPDGEVKKVLSPAVMAEVGASVAVLEVAASGRLGLGEDNNMLGVYGKGEVKGGAAEAKAKVSFSKNEVYAGASAEADLLKAEGTAGVSVLGTDIGVSGAVKVGVGAHAEIGYTDGKLKVDVGAAIGVGVDIGFEVDVSGTVDAIAGWAESAWDKLDWW